MYSEFVSIDDVCNSSRNARDE